MEFAEDVKSEWFCSDDPNIPMMPLSMQSCSNAQLMSFDQSESEISCVPTSFYQDDIDSMPMEKFDNSNTSGLDFSEKTPFMALNELFPCVAQSVQWENVTTPTGQLFFRCVASYEGQQFVGEGRNKKEAKQLMAQAALAQLPSAPIRVEKKRKRVESGGDVKTEDFASDEPATGRISPPPKKRAKVNWKEIHLRPGITPTSRLLVDKCGDKSPPWQVQTEFRTIAADQTLPVRFEAKITVDSRTFSSIGMTRKTANDAAAKTALKELFDVDTTQLEKTQLLEELGGKNILMAVNEVCNTRGLTVVSDLQNLSKDPRGPSIFQAKYTVEGKLFEGIPAASKKSARVNAAKLVMKDLFDLDCDNKDCVTAGASSAALISSEPKIRSEAAKLIPKPENIVIDSNKNAISLLNELCVKCTPVTGPAIPEYEMVSEQLNRTLKRMSFTVRVVVGDKTFEGSGTTKKLAKFRAAKEALRQLFDVKDIKDPCATTFVSAGKFLLPSGCDTTPPSIEVSPVADLVADLVKAKFTEICEANSILPGKEIAGFVVTRGNVGDNLPDATVVSIGGGTKCIAGGNISREGASIHDCHAEILARRGLIMYFYQQLFMLTNPTTADLSIFESRPGGKGYRLKENVQLHLFITSAPCGDSRIFSMQDEVNPSLQVDLNPLRKSRAVLRVKLENGCGTISLLSTNLNPLQTFDAIVGGERFLCLSCSDKVLKWNVLGLQGALLSHFVEPIYLSTLVLGSLFHQAHVVRSCFERIAPSLKLVSPGFRLNQHCCSTVSCPEPRTTVKAPNTAYCWSIATSQLELITQELGKTLVGEASRVCKRRFFEEFHRIYGKLSHLVQVDEEPKAYCDAKRLSHEYEVQKLEFYRALKESNCGVWAKKPPEVDDFSLPNSSVGSLTC